MSEHNVTITLIEKPELKIQSCKDGVWLHFKTDAGQCSSINLPVALDNRHFRGKVIDEWCRQFAVLQQQAEDMKGI